MTVIGSIELPYSFSMLMGRNPYGNPVSKGDRGINFGHPVCTFNMQITELELIVSGLLPQPYRGGAWARGGGIDIYFFNREPERQALRTIINNCIRIHPVSPTTPRVVPYPVPAIHEDGVDIAIVGPSGIDSIIASCEAELQSRDDPPMDIIAEARQMPMFLELEAPTAGDRIHFGGRFWKPFYTSTYLTAIYPASPIMNYGIAVHIPFDVEYSHFINGMLAATV